MAIIRVIALIIFITVILASLIRWVILWLKKMKIKENKAFNKYAAKIENDEEEEDEEFDDLEELEESKIESKFDKTHLDVKQSTKNK